MANDPIMAMHGIGKNIKVHGADPSGKPESSQPADAGASNKAQGEASGVCERNPGLAGRIPSPRSGRSKPAGVWSGLDIAYQQQDFDHPLRGFVLTT
jgi:hypothetical protein